MTAPPSEPMQRLAVTGKRTRRKKTLLPPQPPPSLTPALALDPATSQEVLWDVARGEPQLRRWLIANPAASPELLEFVAQVGGPGVREGFEVLFDDSS